MTFANRHQAADLLADALAAYKGRHPLILAIPRGAVPMGQRLARALEGELDVVLVRLRQIFEPFGIGIETARRDFIQQRLPQMRG